MELKDCAVGVKIGKIYRFVKIEKPYEKESVIKTIDEVAAGKNNIDFIDLDLDKIEEVKNSFYFANDRAFNRSIYYCQEVELEEYEETEYEQQ